MLPTTGSTIADDRFEDTTMNFGNQPSRQAKRKGRSNHSVTIDQPAKKRDIVPVSPIATITLSHSDTEDKSLLTEPHGGFKMIDTSHTLSDMLHQSIVVHSTNCLGQWGAGFAAALRAQYPVAQKVYTQHCKSFIPAKKRLPEKDAVGTCLLIPPQDEQEGTPKVWIACLFTSYSYGSGTKTKPKKDDPETIIEQTRTALEDMRSQLEMIKAGQYQVKLSGRYGHTFNLRTLRFPKLELPQPTKFDNTAEEQQQAGDANDEDRNVAISPAEHVDEDNASPKKDPPADPAVEKAQAHDRDKVTGSFPPPKMVIYSPMFNSGNFGVPWDNSRKLVEETFQSSGAKWYVFLAKDKKAGRGGASRQ